MSTYAHEQYMNVRRDPCVCVCVCGLLDLSLDLLLLISLCSPQSLAFTCASPTTTNNRVLVIRCARRSSLMSTSSADGMAAP